MIITFRCNTLENRLKKSFVIVRYVLIKYYFDAQSRLWSEDNL